MSHDIILSVKIFSALKTIIQIQCRKGSDHCANSQIPPYLLKCWSEVIYFDMYISSANYKELDLNYSVQGQ